MDKIYDEIINKMKNKYGSLITDLLFNNCMQEVYIEKYQDRINELEKSLGPVSNIENDQEKEGNK